MTVQNGERIKATQEVNMPDAVIAMNVFYFEADFQEAQEDVSVVNALLGWMGAIYTTMNARMSSACSMGIMSVYTYDSVADQWDPIGSGIPTATPGNVNEMLPHGVCLMVRAYTTAPRTIGRKYIPGLTDEDNNDGAWEAAALTAGAAWGNAWDTTVNIDVNNSLVPGVFSKVFLTVFQLNGVEVVLADPTYQRRRRPGVGT